MYTSDQRAPKTFVVYRCDRCGFLSYGSPPQIELDDPQGPPDISVQCPCYMGPRWVRGEWTAHPHEESE